MRTPKPWYWSARKGWYVQIDGKQTRLGAAETKTKNPPEDVRREYHRLMACQGLVSDEDRRKALVPEVVEAFIASKAATRAKTVKTYLFHLEPFAQRYRSRQLGAIKSSEVLTFVASRTTWGDSTKHSAIVAVKGLFRWARDAGYLDTNPMAGLMNPYPVGRRDRGITLDEFEKMIGAVRDAAFKTVLRFLRDTGCRPGELCKLTARHLDPVQPIATLKPGEHKTGSRTGRCRTILLPGTIADELRQLARHRPTGPLLLNTKGDPWRPNTIEKRVRRLRRKLGLPDDVVPYAARHSFLTRLVELGTPLAIAAKIAGHSRVDTIQDVYLHPEMSAMKEAVEKAASGVKTA
jgi:integrase